MAKQKREPKELSIREKIDWSQIDWNQSVKDIVAQTNTPVGTVYAMRRQYSGLAISFRRLKYKEVIDKIDWSQIDWSQWVGEITAQTKLPIPFIYQQRKLLDKKIRSKRRTKKPFGFEKVDWEKVDWNKPVRELVIELGLIISVIYSQRKKYAPDVSHQRGYKTKDTTLTIDWIKKDTALAKERNSSRAAMNALRHRYAPETCPLNKLYKGQPKAESSGDSVS